MKSIRRVLTFIGRLIEPVKYLWPWFLGDSILAIFVTSPQGVAISTSPAYAGSWLEVDLVICFVSLIAAFSAATNLVVARARRDLRIDDRKRFGIAGLIIDGVWVTVVATLPSVLLAISTGIPFVVASLALLALTASCLTWLVVSENDSQSVAQRTLRAARRHRFWFAAVIAIVAMIPLWLGALIAARWPAELSGLGPSLTILVGTSCLATVLACILIALPLIIGLPWSGIAVVGLAVAFNLKMSPVFDAPGTGAHAESKESRSQCMEGKGRPGDLSGFRESFGRRGLRISASEPAYMVSAEGGGIRAAYWTATTLAQLDLETADAFSRRVFLLSGVSGGSLGVATWLAAREKAGSVPSERMKLITSFLSSDFLSPLIGGFLYLDVPRLIFGRLWFTARRDQAFEKALASRWREVGGTDFFDREYFRLCLRSFGDSPPDVVFGSTDALTGTPVQLTAGDDRSFEGTTIEHASVAEAVHLSARFPFLSPAAEVGTNAGKLWRSWHPSDGPSSREIFQKGFDQATIDATSLPEAEELRRSGLGVYIRTAVLVDGGYVDNSALAPALRILRDRKFWIKTNSPGAKADADIPIRLVHISNDPGRLCLRESPGDPTKASQRVKRFLDVSGQNPLCRYDYDELEGSLSALPFGWLTTPIQTLLAVRSQQGAAKSEALAEQILAPAKSPVKSVGSAPLVGNEQWSEFSVKTSIYDALNLPDFGDRMASLPTINRQEVATIRSTLFAQEAQMRRQTSAYQRTGALEGAALTKYLRQLDEWHASINEVFATDKGCDAAKKPESPPLGWVLSRQNANELNCLRAFAARRNLNLVTLPAVPSTVPVKPLDAATAH
ncbi:patatin-like phospholipase family protein [Caballeronia sp. LZ032]|uniref:patatin-like phospholipase family protein n=1 Tax=Caballeronia sp. LZ032 TaxID=3038565 RepID=UPI0028590ADD|nr:patatin-like phospholipase family protein [Caballeronia sp. LZ032]MDR5884083.1 hypothetical protein [Caballeronia sp. LZ032]